MATTQPHNDGPCHRASISSTTSTTSAPASTKLRDSCTACATSKVKCSKEKPTCTRCARRGISCEYTPSKRTGRTSQFASKHAAAQRARNSIDIHITQLPQDFHSMGQQYPVAFSPTMMSPLSMSPTNLSRHSSETNIHNLHGQSFPQSSWSMPGSLSHAQVEFGFPALMTPTPTDTEMDEIFSTMPTFPQTITERDVYLIPASSEQSSVELNAFETFSMSGSLPMAPPMNIPQGEAATPSGLHAMFQPNPAVGNFDCSRKERSDNCLTAVLAFLTQLFPKAPSCTLPGGHQSVSQVPTIDSVISENKHIIESLTKMLDCPCSCDEYLITLISLVVLKLIAWYGAAARGSAPEEEALNNNYGLQMHHGSTQSYPEQVRQFPAMVGNYCVDRNEQVRMAAQLVLSELHRVQRLVQLLSNRFESIRHRRAMKSSAAASGPTDATVGTANHASLLSSAAPLSAPTFDQLEADLRVRMRAVSLETIELLRRGA